MNRRFVFTVIALCFNALLANEPSAFGAGDLNSKQPYGLTQEEKEILHNRKKLEELRRHSAEQNDQAETLQERIDGMQSILESMLQNSQKSRREFENFKHSIEGLTSENEELFKQLDLFSSNIEQNSQSIAALKTELGQFSQSLESNLSLYVTKKEHNALVEDVNVLRQEIVKQFQKLNAHSAKKSSSQGFANKTLAAVEKEAKANYNRKYYTKAIEAYEYLIKKQYKPARSHYMIAQMLFYRKKYDEALSYYKKSAELYAKASYMPTLMLNAAFCMQKTGDLKNAKKFYTALSKKYPSSDEAKKARKRLQTIK